MYTDKAPKVEASLQYIQEHLVEPLSLEEISHQVGYSPYHFTRLFKAHMGIPLFYYVSALRLQKAKDLLIHTDFTIRDIALEVGHQSLGTFTTRFTEKVGISPAAFRQTRTEGERVLEKLHELSENKALIDASSGHCSITGTIEADVPYQGVVLVGLFPKPIPEGMPLYGTLAMLPGEFCLSGIQPGIYYLMATSLSWGMEAEGILLTHKALRTRNHKPLTITPGTLYPRLKIKLYPPKLDDPPIVVSLPILMKRYLQRNQ